MKRSQIVFFSLQTFLSWLIFLVIAIYLAAIIFALYSIKIYYRQRLKNIRPPYIIVSNHLTLIDSYFIGFAVAFPEMYWRPWRMPWHLPEQRNYFRGLLVLIMWLSRAIPIIRGMAPRTQKKSLDKVVAILNRKQSISIFLEGTRSRSGRVDRYTHGIGKIYLDVPNCTILPVYHRGIENVLPIGVNMPRLFKKIDIVIGEPRKLTTEKQGYEAIADIARQIFNILQEMEKEYFESGKYRAQEIIKQK